MPYNPTLHQSANKSIAMSIAAPVDARSYFYDTTLFRYRPYRNRFEANTYLNTTTFRRGHFSVFVNSTGVLNVDGTFTGGAIEEYWYENGVTNDDLVLKAAAGGGGTVDWVDITSKPTTLSGYAITDAAPLVHTHAFSSLTSKPTTLAGYGIADGVATTGSYANPAWITSLAWAKITTRPTTLLGYGITNAVVSNGAIVAGTYTKVTADTKGLITLGAQADTDDIAEGSTNLYWTTTRGDARYPQLGGSYANPSWITSLAWSKLTSIPSTVAGFGISDAVTTGGIQTVTGAKTFSTSVIGVTAALSDNSTKFATTAWVKGQGYGGAGAAAWGSLTGVLADQTDLVAELATKQDNIQFRDETVALGTSGTVTSINFTGSGVTATRSTNALTVTIPGGGGSLTDTDGLTEGATNLYYTNARVRACVLTGLSLVTATAITAADTVLTAFGKVQAQITADKATMNAHIANVSNPHSTTKAQVGLGSVDNTSDANKPVSTAQATAIALKVTANSAITGATRTKITYDAKGLVTAGANATTDDIIEGAKLFWTQSRFDTALALKDTADLTEGTNLYFTTARARASFTAGSGISISSGVITATGGGGGGSCFDTLAVFCNNVASTVPAGTSYTGFNGGGLGSTITSRVMIAPASGTLKSLYIYTSTTQPGTGALVVTVMRGTSLGTVANTALTKTIPINATTNVFSDTSNSVPINAGEYIVVKLANAASGASANVVSITMVLTNE